jgi:hypothetical protein
MFKSREEELFWKMVDAYGRPDPGGVARQGSFQGICYIINNEALVIPWLAVNCCVTSLGINAQLCTNYDGCGSEKEDELQAQIPSDTVIAEKFYAWADFCFDEFIAWTISCNEWEKVLNIYKTRT